MIDLAYYCMRSNHQFKCDADGIYECPLCNSELKLKPMASTEYNRLPSLLEAKGKKKKGKVKRK